MRKIILFMVLVFVCSFFSPTIANSAWLKQGEYLEKHQWGALEDILGDWRAGKITTDECALYGCYVLTAQEPARTDRNEKMKKLPLKYKLDKKSVEAAPYFFIRFLYENEEKLGVAALSEFRSSDWSDNECWEKFKNNDKIIEIIKKTNRVHAGVDYYCRDIFSIADEIIKNKLMEPAEIYVIAYSVVYASHFHKLIQRHQDFLLKYLIGFDNSYFLTLMYSDYLMVSHNRKAINVINFINHAQENLMMLNKLDVKAENDFFIVEGGTVQQNEKYLKLFSDYYNKLCITNKFQKPVNHYFSKKITIILDNVLTNYAYGQTTPNNSTFVNECKIILYLKKMESSTAALPIDKTVIHELFHAIQYSYDDKDDDPNNPQKYHWYSPRLSDKTNVYYNAGKILSESTASWISDLYYEIDTSSTYYSAIILQSPMYFFRNPKEDTGFSIDLSFPCYGLMHGDDYAYSFFWTYFNSFYPQINVVKEVWNKMATQNPISAMVSVVEKNTQNNNPTIVFVDILHKFAINNFLVTKHDGIYADEKHFYDFKLSNSVRTNLTVRDDKLSEKDIAKVTTAFEQTYSIPPMATKFIKLIPDKDAYFQNYFTMTISWDKAFHVRPALFLAWVDVDTNDNHNSQLKYQHVPIFTSSSGASYVYYTKKGINPKFFILAMTSDGQNNNWTGIADVKVLISFEKTDENVSLSSAALITKAGEQFKNDVSTIFSEHAISNMITLDSEICKLYDDYLKNKNEFTAKQIVQKIRNLNLLMQTNMVAVHDLRYQYYLYKNSCVDKIIAGASSQSVIKQVEKLKKFIDEIKIDDYNNSINVANAYIISNHAQMKLKSIKEVDPEEWDMGQATYDKINKIAKTITGNSKYPYWYTNVELQEAVSSPFIGIPEDECPGPLLIPGFPTKGPFPVNYCPGIRKQLDSLKIPSIYNISSKLKSISITVSGTTYNASNMLCVRDKFDPLSLAYFSALKKHRYHEDNMPPVPSVSNIRNYVSLLGYYMKICKNFSFCNSEELAYSKKIMISGASNRIMEIIVLITEAIIKEKQETKTELYEKYKQVVSESEYCSEILDLTEKQLARDGFRESN